VASRGDYREGLIVRPSYPQNNHSLCTQRLAKVFSRLGPTVPIDFLAGHLDSIKFESNHSEYRMVNWLYSAIRACAQRLQGKTSSASWASAELLFGPLLLIVLQDHTIEYE